MRHPTVEYGTFGLDAWNPAGGTGPDFKTHQELEVATFMQFNQGAPIGAIIDDRWGTAAASDPVSGHAVTHDSFLNLQSQQPYLGPIVMFGLNDTIDDHFNTMFTMPNQAGLINKSIDPASGERRISYLLGSPGTLNVTSNPTFQLGATVDTITFRQSAASVVPEPSHLAILACLTIGMAATHRMRRSNPRV